MYRFGLLVLLLAGVVGPTSAPRTRAVVHPPPAVRSVDQVAAATRDQLDASRVPAASFAVVDGDDVATGARGTGVSGHTPFILGSVSKSLTALAVMRLRDRGPLQLDTPVSRYVPGFETATAGAAITVRQLLDQTSGLPTSAGLDVLDHPGATLGQRVRDAASVTLTSTPGARFAYCNLNYAILGRVVELISGESFARYVEKGILAPLDMMVSRTSIATAEADGLPDGFSVWFGHDVALKAASHPGALPYGYLISSRSTCPTTCRRSWEGGPFVIEGSFPPRVLLLCTPSRRGHPRVLPRPRPTPTGSAGPAVS